MGIGRYQTGRWVCGGTRPITLKDQCSILNYTALYQQWHLIDSSNIYGGEITCRLDLSLNPQFLITTVPVVTSAGRSEHVKNSKKTASQAQEIDHYVNH